MNNDQVLRAQLLDMQQSFLVQAPAGSGKTSVLVQRYLCALAIAQNGPEEVIAITFTRKAAAEMRERILNALQAASNEAAPDNAYDLKLWQLAKKVLLRDQQLNWNILDNPARLKIQTIDALCASITKQMPILSRFGAQPQIAVNPEMLYSKAVDQLLQSIDHATEYPYKNSLFKLLEHLDNDRLKVKRLLLQALSTREHWLPLIVQHSGSNNLRTYLEQGLVFACAEALEDLNALRPPVLDLAVAQADEPQSLDEWLAIVEKFLTAEGEWRKTVTAAQGFHPPSKAKNKEEKLQLQAAKDAMLAMLERLHVHDDFRHSLSLLRELPPLSYSNQQWTMVESLMTLLPVLAAQLNVVFRDQGQVDFVAVALAALTALQDQDAPTDLALALDCKIQHILVDEFQDTSHIQFKLLEQLTVNWQPGDGRTLFLVGDPMQSIYSFRQADVGLFIKARDQGIGELPLEFVQLTSNFRSSAPVVAWINAVFKRSFPSADNKTLGAITYTEALATKEQVIATMPVDCISVYDTYVGEQIVKIIQRTKIDTPKATIAILVRAKSHLEKILPALRVANISFQGIDIETLSKRPLIQDLLALTKAILHLDDRIAWLAILRAPWCGITLVDLQIIAQYPGAIFTAIQDPSLVQQLDITAQPRVKHLAKVLAEAIALIGRCSLEDLFTQAADKLGIQNTLRSVNEYLEWDAYLHFLEQITQQPEINVPGFIDHELEKLFLQPANIAGSNDVQIMTIHKAKGLEFDVVILPDLDKTTRSFDQELLLLEQRDYEHQYLLFAPIRAADQEEDNIYKYLAWCRRQRAEYETLREFYVAVTRARHKIYCLANVDGANRDQTKKITGMLKHVWHCIETQFKTSAIVQQTTLEPDRSLRRLPNSCFTEQKHDEIFISKTTTQLRPWQLNWVNQAGTILHRILCHIAQVGIEKIATNYITTVPVICAKHLRASGLSTDDQNKVQNLIVKAIDAMFTDPLGRKILSTQHKETYTEWRLTTRQTEQFQHVRLDRVFVDQDNTLWLVDYKLVLDQSLGDAVSAYATQMHQYAQILRDLRPQQKLVAGLYFPLQKNWIALM